MYITGREREEGISRLERRVLERDGKREREVEREREMEGDEKRGSK